MAREMERKTWKCKANICCDSRRQSEESCSNINILNHTNGSVGSLLFLKKFTPSEEEFFKSLNRPLCGECQGLDQFEQMTKTEVKKEFKFSDADFKTYGLKAKLSPNEMGYNQMTSRYFRFHIEEAAESKREDLEEAANADIEKRRNQLIKAIARRKISDEDREKLHSIIDTYDVTASFVSGKSKKQLKTVVASWMAEVISDDKPKKGKKQPAKKATKKRSKKDEDEDDSRIGEPNGAKEIFISFLFN
eukprot:TRINITY_DN5247_c0_g2_i1.p1 TRINITY_DN5247_c0_g2~~TRINITY_DN5247_c0_g2_i1.p1  ORF type:complete len:248 (-),score=58.38 TRINITY_DN5247_c0_g2_i1:47-790(-)